jgi:hypothetical protein
MAGFYTIYVIGGLGGFQGSDGVNPIALQIWVEDADRQCLKPHYVNPSIRPLGNIDRIVPEAPNHPDALLDACIAFFPKHFRQCPSFAAVARKIESTTRLDFHAGADKIPAEWVQLRKEARPYFRELNIFEAKLVRLHVE